MAASDKTEPQPPRAGPTDAEAPPPIIETAADLLTRYDVLFSDIWGVIHDGHTAHRGAVDALLRFRAAGGSVILVSNAPVPEHRVAAMLDYRHVPRAAWDAIVCSGAIALRHIAEQGYRRAYNVGPRDRDRSFFEMSPAADAPLDEAEALVCTGLVDDVNETPEDYRPLLEAAHARALPFVCANPDLVVDVGTKLYYCAGAIADIYAALGGSVFWAGKPHPVAYATARAEADRIRGGAVPADRILVVGDALRTDLAAAANAGLDALFIAGGIHRGEVVDDERIVPAKLARLFGPGAPPALAAMPVLRW